MAGDQWRLEAERQCMTDQITDRSLLDSFAQRGDTEAFAALTQRTAGMVYATCRRIVGDAALAQDAAQETFLQLLRNPQSVTGSVGAWLHRVATNKALDLVRGEGRLHR